MVPVNVRNLLSCAPAPVRVKKTHAGLAHFFVRMSPEDKLHRSDVGDHFRERQLRGQNTVKQNRRSSRVNPWEAGD